MQERHHRHHRHLALRPTTGRDARLLTPKSTLSNAPSFLSWRNICGGYHLLSWTCGHPPPNMSVIDYHPLSNTHTHARPIFVLHHAMDHYVRAHFLSPNP